MKTFRRAPGPFRMQLICDTNLEYFRNVILGARHYGFTTGRMVLVDRWIAREEETNLAATVRRDRIDGIIAQVQEKRFEDQLMRLPVPVVNISNALTPSRLPLVTQDDDAVGRLAAEHLLARGCAVFGFWGQVASSFSDERKRGFQAALQNKLPGARCIETEGPPIAEETGAPLIRRMARWLKRLPRPLGIFTVLDTFALHLLRAAQGLGLRVPEDAAILGAGDDEFWVEFESIPLSSVKLPSRQIGYEAAALLDTLMTKGKKHARNQHLPVTEVAARRSTDVLFVEDEAVTRAVAYIREHAAENVYVENVVRAAGISRSGLQARFKRALGRSMLDEIQSTRIARVRLLLRTTGMKLSAIAEACDFPDTPRLHVLFRQHTGQTPGQYRAMFRKV
jgi:LacI family transcriptional regulator